jgi:tRNA A-37 threonylcarbamoyl transferase component Bud32
VSDVDALIAAGKHRAAAERLLADGQPRRAADIFEQLWEFAAAARAAQADGDLARALRNALEARDEPLAAALLDELRRTPVGQAAALEALVRVRRFAPAADLAIELGDRERAIDLLQRAHRDLDAARLLVELGRDRDAGLVLERALEVAAGDEAAAMHLALGKVLARRGALPDAARHLQHAATSPASAPEARGHLIGTLASLDLRDAARDVLRLAREHEPELPADLDTFLREFRARQPAAPPRSVDVIAGRYRVERALGHGAAGRVVLAYDEVAGRQVALKIIHGAGAHGGAAYERFRREAQITSALRHPCLVETYDVAFEQGLLVMEYLPGGSLAERLAGGQRQGEAAVRKLALELVSALEAAHQRGVVHRDLKPANVFFDARGTAKLGDFGVAHVVDLGQTQTGGLIGTLAYMSPEQITGAPISVAADVYGLGVTLFEALTGRLPHVGPDFVAQHLGDAPPLASTVSPGLAAGWDVLLASMLGKTPGERPSLQVVRQRLEAIAVGRALGLTPVAGTPIDEAGATERDRRAEPGDDVVGPGPRYAFETRLGRTATARLSRAVDRVLDRSVVLERFDEGPATLARFAHVRALAGVASPFVQRALALDVAERLAVFEAPAGAPWADARLPDHVGEILRLAKRLARGLAAMHERQVAHGAIGPTTVVVDEGAIPTLLVAGLPPSADDAALATPAADVRALLALLAALLEVDAAWPAIAGRFTRAPGPAEPRDGAALYLALDDLELAYLRAGADGLSA